MPELPEVETIKRDLKSEIVGLCFTDFRLLWPGSLQGIDELNFKKAALNQKIIAVERKAKNLIIRLENGQNLLMHMKMTGHLLIEPDEYKIDTLGSWIQKEGSLSDPLNQFIRAIFWLNNGKIMAFSDLRKFGYIRLADNTALAKALEKYGPEPFDSEFNTIYLNKIFAKKNQAIKKVLMSQELIAGIGNIYADEILWKTKIHPEKKANTLSEKEIALIVETTKDVLTRAIKLRGTSTSDYRDTKGKKGSFEDELKAYKQNGKPCQRCGNVIKKIVVGGRGTHLCPSCQKESK